MTPRGVALLLLSVSPAASAEEPWSVSPEHPAVQGRGEVPRRAAPAASPPGSSSAPQLVVEALLEAWSSGPTRVDGPSCVLVPTCGTYGYQVVARHGWLLGAVMAAERVMRWHADLGQYGLAIIHGRWRLLDPLCANDFWLGGPPCAR